MNQASDVIVKTASILFVSVVTAALTGCVPFGPPGLSQIADVNGLKQDCELMMQRSQISIKFQKNPDTDDWLEQRRKIVQASGDRLFDKDFNRVFDSVVVAVSSLELRVDNMERQSGYIAASGIALAPTEAKALRRQAVRDWCIQNNFDPSLPERQFRSRLLTGDGDANDFGSMMAPYEKRQKSLNFQLTKVAANETKVKLRFSEVYYPAEVESFYKLVWRAVDKQIFMDQNIEGTVAPRQ